MDMGADGNPAAPPAAGGGITWDNILGFFGIGGGDGTKSLPPTLPTGGSDNSTSNPEELAGGIMRGLQNQNVRNWGPDQIKAFVEKVVAQTNCAVTPEQAVVLLQSAQQGR